MTADESGARGAQDARGLGALTHQSAHEERPEDAARRMAREALWLRQELERVKTDRRAWRIAAFASLAASLAVALGLTASGVCS